MGEPLRVDPAALSGAGSAVAELSSGLTAAVGSLTSGYNANTGQDAAGAAFGLAYQDSASAVVEAVAKGVNALRHIGFLIQGSATNYSRAEAAADISDGAAPLPAPVAPAQYSAPGGDPDVNGPGQSPPVLWYLVEALVGDWWPNGDPGQLRAAAGAWTAFTVPLYAVTGQNAGAYATIDAQQMPDKEPMKTAVRDVGTAMSSLAGEAQQLARQLASFASDVETTQSAIRDLLNKLTSVVGSVIDQGVVGTVFELVTGDAEEKIHEVANDIKAVIANHKRQSAARKELLAQLASGIKNYTRAMEIHTRVELVNYLGEDAGRIVTNVGDAVTDTSVGLALGGINTVGVVTSFDPVGDPKGTWAMIEGLGKMAQVLNPVTAPVAFATDPQGSLDLVKDVTHFDDIFTSNRPFIGIGELGFDIGTAVIPGGAGVKAAGGARAAEGAAARAEVTATERAAGEMAEIASATGGLRGVAHDVEGVTAKLDDLNKTTLDGGKSPSGSPGPLPKAPEPGVSPAVTREPVPSGAPGKATSAPASGDSVPPPVTHTPRAEPAPTAEAPSAPARSEVAAPPPAASPPSGMPPASPPAPPELPHGGAASAPLEAPHEPPPVAAGNHPPPGPSEGAAHDAQRIHSGQSGHGGDTSPNEAEHPDRSAHDDNKHSHEPGHTDSDSPHDWHQHEAPDEVPPLLVREDSFETGGIQPRFVGERWPGGPMGWPGVTYLDEATREAYRITIQDGLVYDAQGRLFDTSEGVSAFAGPGNEGRAIFVMDKHGNLYASTRHQAGIFHHSSFFAGGEVASAGELVVKDGRIELLTDHSGHYAPGRSRTLQVLEQLASQGVVIDPARIDYWAAEGS